MKLLDTRRHRTTQTDGALTIALSYRLPLIIDTDRGSPDPNFVVTRLYEDTPQEAAQGFDSEATNERTVHASSSAGTVYTLHVYIEVSIRKYLQCISPNFEDWTNYGSICCAWYCTKRKTAMPNLCLSSAAATIGTTTTTARTTAITSTTTSTTLSSGTSSSSSSSGSGSGGSSSSTSSTSSSNSTAVRYHLLDFVTSLFLSSSPSLILLSLSSTRRGAQHPRPPRLVAPTLSRAPRRLVLLRCRCRSTDCFPRKVETRVTQPYIDFQLVKGRPWRKLCVACHHESPQVLETFVATAATVNAVVLFGFYTTLYRRAILVLRARVGSLVPSLAREYRVASRACSRSFARLANVKRSISSHRRLSNAFARNAFEKKKEEKKKVPKKKTRLRIRCGRRFTGDHVVDSILPSSSPPPPVLCDDDSLRVMTVAGVRR
ncbi:hypothetical protein ALC62_10487 [Cyphomyrmex costatus]|uniref:Uncharacterized protein n=1 Tax=Cyphomyrmex costatus TaxID=456900 RepID=A0A151IDN5_9HYME|nr:hypothetical protein ALC62_10487 [Cyphomyrmex costatus]